MNWLPERLATTRLNLSVRQLDAPYLSGVYLTWASASSDCAPEHEDLMVVIEGYFFHAEIYDPEQWTHLVQQLQVNGILKPLVLEAWAQQQINRADLPPWARPTPRGEDDLFSCEPPGKN